MNGGAAPDPLAGEQRALAELAALGPRSFLVVYGRWRPSTSRSRPERANKVT